MKSIQSTSYPVHFGETGFGALQTFLTTEKISKIFVLVDENTKAHCLPIVLKKIPLENFTELLIPAGEAFKNLTTCTHLWDELTEKGADRKSLLINIGGGVITDLGGFVASAYKRGIAFINISTTLLGMVDATVGSKTGVDLGVLKNQIGFFADPKMVIIAPIFLKTLPKRELTSAYAEIIKYGLSYDKKLWEDFYGLKYKNIDEVIYRSVAIKNEVVLKDKKESALRKVLNFGHTVGHAVESYFLAHPQKENITHGEAISVGMVVACAISTAVLGFEKEKTDRIKNYIISVFGKIPLEKSDYPKILNLLKHDKKNTAGKLNFVLLKDVGKFQLDCQVSEEHIIKGLDEYVK